MQTEITTTEPMKNTPSTLATGPMNWVSPFQAMEDWLDELESHWMMPRPFHFGIPRLSLGWMAKTPRVDIIDREHELCVKAELPGVDKDQLSVSIQDNRLTIQASVAKDEEEEKGTYHRRERLRGEYQRVLELPVPVDADKAKCSFKHGVMELVVPKKPGFSPKKITID